MILIITFGCERENQLFDISLVDGVKDGYLINPIVADARTEITTELLSDKGYAVIMKMKKEKKKKKTFFQKDFEKKFFSEETNKIFCETFLRKCS